MALRVGRFRARGIAGSEQFGVSGDKQTLTITVNLAVAELGCNVGVYLYFSPGSAPFSLERLRAMGWKGADIRNLSGIESNEVILDITEEEFGGKKRFKVEIMTSGGVRPGESISKDEFATRLQAAIGSIPAGDAEGGVRYDANGDQIPF